MTHHGGDVFHGTIPTGSRYRQFFMTYYLAKTEPSTYSIDDLAIDRHTVWDGVTNPQAVKTIVGMRKGDKVLIYHSGGVSAIVGVAAVIEDGRPDPKNPKSAVANLEFVAKLDAPVSLAEIKSSHQFDDWALVRQGRLSTMAVPEVFVKWLRKHHPNPAI
jgi:predicted RNA-binding protein with PUA-like domain